MAHCSKYMKRFRETLKYRKLSFPQDIIDTIGKRAKSDRELDMLICDVCDILEPPSCQKSHCPHYTAYGFCSCALSLVSGKCKLNLEYLKRKREKEDKILNSRLEQVPASYLPLSKETIEKVKNMSQPEWDKQIKKIIRNSKK